LDPGGKNKRERERYSGTRKSESVCVSMERDMQEIDIETFLGGEDTSKRERTTSNTS
jgi:hypothetical protein